MEKMTIEMIKMKEKEEEEEEKPSIWGISFSLLPLPLLLMLFSMENIDRACIRNGCGKQQRIVRMLGLFVYGLCVRLSRLCDEIYLALSTFRPFGLNRFPLAVLDRVWFIVFWLWNRCPLPHRLIAFDNGSKRKSFRFFMSHSLFEWLESLNLVTCSRVISTWSDFFPYSQLYRNDTHFTRINNNNLFVVIVVGYFRLRADIGINGVKGHSTEFAVFLNAASVGGRANDVNNLWGKSLGMIIVSALKTRLTISFSCHFRWVHQYPMGHTYPNEW